MNQRAPLKYPGSKQLMMKRLLRHLPKKGDVIICRSVTFKRIPNFFDVSNTESKRLVQISLVLWLANCRAEKIE